MKTFGNFGGVLVHPDDPLSSNTRESSKTPSSTKKQDYTTPLGLGSSLSLNNYIIDYIFEPINLQLNIIIITTIEQQKQQQLMNNQRTGIAILSSLLLCRGMASPDSAQSSATAADQSRQLQTLPALQDVGNNGSPSSAFPLGICEGDCDSNAECQLGLICYQRDGLVEVPGCSGSGTSGTDYCIDREPDELAVIANDGSPSELFPLGSCEGDCDNDSECSL